MRLGRGIRFAAMVKANQKKKRKQKKREENYIQPLYILIIIWMQEEEEEEGKGEDEGGKSMFNHRLEHLEQPYHRHHLHLHFDPGWIHWSIESSCLSIIALLMLNLCMMLPAVCPDRI